MEGIIIGNISNTYKIETIETTYIAHARGKFKNQDIKPLVGDRVEIEVIDEEKNEAIIEEIKTRKNEIKRPKIANIDQIVFIISTKNPKPDLLMLDKQLAYSEKIKIEPIIIVNKCDLKDEYKTIKELDRSILDDFIEKIYIGAVDKETNEREINIVWAI